MLYTGSVLSGLRRVPTASLRTLWALVRNEPLWPQLSCLGAGKALLFSVTSPEGGSAG